MKILTKNREFLSYGRRIQNITHTFPTVKAENHYVFCFFHEKKRIF